MSAHVLLNLLNELGKRDRMRGLTSILSLFRNEFNKFNNTRARMLDSIYHFATLFHLSFFFSFFFWGGGAFFKILTVDAKSFIVLACEVHLKIRQFFTSHFFLKHGFCCKCKSKINFRFRLFMWTFSDNFDEF